LRGRRREGWPRIAPASILLHHEIRIHDLAPISLYNFDVEQAGDPAPVADFKRAIREADGLLIATPEYQHGVPGVLKNALDWASRPPGKSVLQGKAIAIMGASPGFTGTARAQTQLRESFSFSEGCAVHRLLALVRLLRHAE
jgi:chromate reductase